MIKSIFLLMFFSQTAFLSSMNTHTYFRSLFDKDPVPTEKSAYNAFLTNPLEEDVNYLAIPWVYLLNSNQLHKVPNIKLDGGFTICQHVSYRKILPILKKMGIDTLFTPHAKKNEVYEGVSVLPFPHFPQCTTGPKEKTLLYSFAGFNTNYTRRIIFNLPKRDDTVIIERNNWHHWVQKNDKANQKLEYQNLLATSRFSLCPRGVGASTIRIWESFKAGAIPIHISDEMCLPNGLDWDKLIVKVPERETKRLESYIQEISPEEETLLRENGYALYKEYLEGDHFVNFIHFHYKNL